MSILSKLTENVHVRDIAKENHALLEKWEQTGLLEGLDSRSKENMSLMLENQAKQLLKEASAMSTGDVEGFAAVAFPIVRRVFGNLIANELVSVQPMSLPNGLIFFLDFTYTDSKASAGASAGESVYGGGVVGSQLTGGVNLENMQVDVDLWNAEKSAYNLNNAYSSPTGSASVSLTFLAARSGSNGTWTRVGSVLRNGDQQYVNQGDRLINYDPDLSGSTIAVYRASKSAFADLNTDNLVSIHTPSSGSMAAYSQVRRLTREDPLSGSSQLLVVFATYNSGSSDTLPGNVDAADAMNAASSSVNAGGGTQTFTYAVADNFITGGAVGSVRGASPWGLEFQGAATGQQDDIPELDIKVDSVSVEAKTKKLKAVWTPELGQDLNAYHNIDAEVELTSILSEQIALEIDQEILGDLVRGAHARIIHWSRRPGEFVNPDNGQDLTANGANLPDFTGNVSEWYETLIEKINDVSADIHRKTLRGGANFLVTSPEVANILEFTAGFRASVTHDDDKGTVGAVNVGSVNKKWDVWVSPYFPRNVVLVGRKGKSFLESGYVYAPYVPLQVTPTIFDVDQFTPRKGVMTRYAKKMVRADMYGLCIVKNLAG